MDKFPENFLWGTATSSHQVEGNNKNNDWWQWETQSRVKYASGLACNHYQKFSEDFDLAKSLNHNCHRFSIEWSRIEPEKGIFSQKEIEHYRQVIDVLKERGLEPIVTLHHFTNPLWFVKQGGWLSKNSSTYFVRYIQKVAEEFAKDIKFWITINEPMVYVYQSYILGIWPPGERAFFKAKRVVSNLIEAHGLSYETIKEIYQKNNLPEPKISIAKNIRLFLPCNPKSILDKLAVKLRDKYFNYWFLDKIKGYLDFIGLNYYTLDFVKFKGCCLCARHNDFKKNSLGWRIYPEGLFKILIKLKSYGLPVLITENGICTEDDQMRQDFIINHLKGILKAINAGVSVFGYLYWSLLDNFEWDKGFSPRFGLVEVNYRTFERKMRKSALVLANICSTNKIE